MSRYEEVLNVQNKMAAEYKKAGIQAENNYPKEQCPFYKSEDNHSCEKIGEPCPLRLAYTKDTEKKTLKKLNRLQQKLLRKIGIKPYYLSEA